MDWHSVGDGVKGGTEVYRERRSEKCVKSSFQNCMSSFYRDVVNKCFDFLPFQEAKTVRLMD